MTIIGVILCFRGLIQDALTELLEDRIPFLTSSIRDFHSHGSSPHESSLVAELACAAGYSSRVDPALLNTLRQTPGAKIETEDEYLASCLLMVFVAVSIPKLAKSDSSMYQPQLEGHTNNIHCLAHAVNQLLGCLFSLGGHDDTEDRLKEFLALASSSLLRLGQEASPQETKNRESVYILLHQIVQASPFLSMDLLESCFPYSLLRNAYHSVHKVVQSHLISA